MILHLRKTIEGFLVPADEESQEALAKVKPGKVIHGKFHQMRNPDFHRKFFALLRFLYDHWQPGELQSSKFKGIRPQKSFDRFRKDIVILAGFYESSWRLDGSVRIEAKDISFGRMPEEEFEELYQRVIDVGLQRILPRNYDNAKVRKVIDHLLSFS